MIKYERYEHAGLVPYANWRERGIKIPVFDKDNTLTSYHEIKLLNEIEQNLRRQELSFIFPRIAIASNNQFAGEAHKFKDHLESTFGFSEVFSVCKADGYEGKPSPEMGHAIADHFDVEVSELGIIGDRRLTDVRFGLAIGAGAVALCEKKGEGDARWVPTLRIIEKGLVAVETLFKLTN